MPRWVGRAGSVGWDSLGLAGSRFDIAAGASLQPTAAGRCLFRADAGIEGTFFLQGQHEES